MHVMLQFGIAFLASGSLAIMPCSTTSAAVVSTSESALSALSLCSLRNESTRLPCSFMKELAADQEAEQFIGQDYYDPGPYYN